MRTLLALVVVAAAFARAAPLEVDRAPVELLHAQRLDLTERFEIVSVELARASLDARHAGAVELSEALLPTTTAVARGEWTYSLTLREREADGVREGAFDVTLELHGARLGTLRLAQNVANPLAHEGARVTFAAGHALPAAPLFVVQMREVPRGAVFELASAITTGFEYVWRDAAQADNPTLAMRDGETATFLLSNGDGTSPHNFQVLDGSSPPPTTADMPELGDQATLSWTPPGRGRFPYQCQYHPTMSGAIEVTP